MTEYYIPRHMKGRTAAGASYNLFRGIHAVLDAVANSPEANGLGIKPVEEMTDAEWAGIGHNKDQWMAARDVAEKAVADAKAKADAKTTAPPASVQTQSPAPVPIAKAATAS